MPTRYNNPYKPDLSGTVGSHDCPECYGDVPSSMDVNIGNVDNLSLDTSIKNWASVLPITSASHRDSGVFDEKIDGPSTSPGQAH